MANLTQLGILEGLNGFLLVDKPEGLAFTTVVKTVKRLFGLVKVGHGGSLDAMASGLLVLMINDANKYVGDVMGADRSYTGTLRRGATTNTGDAHGAPVPLPAPCATVAELKGDLFQTEPRFATIRKEGTADYEVVDTGDHAPALGHVYRFEVEEAEDAGEASFELKATKGVLPRALAQAMGATLVSLRRRTVGRFSVDKAIPFERLLKTEMRDFPSLVLPVSEAFR